MKQTAINHLLASAMADPRQVSCLEDEKEALKQALEGHCHEAEQAHKYYVDTAKECGEEWAEIAELDGKSTLTDEEQERLAAKKINCDFSRLPNEQTCSIFGPVSAAGFYLLPSEIKSRHLRYCEPCDYVLYLLDERIGPKNTEHTISYITQYILNLPDWVRRVD